MLITCSIDKTVALWDTQNASPTPVACGSKDMNVGRLHSVSCYPSSPWLLACGGGGNELAIWDMESEDAVQKRFADRVNANGATVAASNDGDGAEPDFEALMAAGDSNAATSKALDGMNKSKKKKKGKKKKAHKGKQ